MQQNNSLSYPKIFLYFILIIAIFIIQTSNQQIQPQIQKQDLVNSLNTTETETDEIDQNQNFNICLEQQPQDIRECFSGIPWLCYYQNQPSQFYNDNFVYLTTPKGNKIWAGALNLAWNEIKQKWIENQNLTFQNLNPFQEKMVNTLNSQSFSRKDISQTAYYTNSGYGSSIVKRINKQVRQKFPEKTFADINEHIPDSTFIAYSYIFKKLLFKYPFKSNKFLFNGRAAPGFQAQNSKQKAQIYYKYYNNFNDFLIGIETDSLEDEVLFLRYPQQQMKKLRFQKLVKMIEISEGLQNKKISSSDKFKMPELNFKFTRNIEQLKDAIISNQQLSGLSFDLISQKIDLIIDSNGVKVQNQVVMQLASYQPGTKKFMLNSDFWVILKQKNKMPYLIMYVHSPNQTWQSQKQYQELKQSL